MRGDRRSRVGAGQERHREKLGEGTERHCEKSSEGKEGRRPRRATEGYTRTRGPYCKYVAALRGDVRFGAVLAVLGSRTIKQ